MAAIEAEGIGANGSNSAGSAATVTLASAALLSAVALVAGFAASLAKRLNAGTRRTAIAVAAITFTLNLNVVSSIARRDSPVYLIAGYFMRSWNFKKHRITEKKSRDRALQAVPANPMAR
jgi:chromate transport protein ChrA